MKNYKISSLYTILMSCLLVVSCARSPGENMELSKSCAQKKAEEFISVKYPDFDKKNKMAVINDVGENWEFTYELPDNLLGGSPVVVINKQSCEIVKFYRTQ
jgi:hypothetical protein